MRRLASGFVTVWLLFFVPSLIFWGVAYRTSRHGEDWFSSAWHWLADTLAFPLILSPITDPAWRWLDEGQAARAAAGFLLLIVIWATIIALPLIFVAGWWMVLSRRLAPSSPGFSAYPTSTGRSSYAALPSSVHSPAGALYLITIPVALVAVGLRRLAAGSVVPTAIALFVVTALLVAGLFAMMFGFSTYWDRYDVLTLVSDTLWHGYLDTLHIPRIFNERWQGALHTIYEVTGNTEHDDWPAYMGHWYRHPEFRTLVWITAVRHGLAVVAVYLGYRLLRRVF
ncbi:MAG: hypothetical protein ACRDJW_25510 [Thermomicrobiales bacterium]